MKSPGVRKKKVKGKSGKKKGKLHGETEFPKRGIEISELEQRVVSEAPKRGDIVFAEPDTETSSGPLVTTTFFHDLPISKRTQESMNQHGFTKLTEIQKYAIPHALCGRDVCGEAKTGSGKTLAFLVPLVELLYRRQWSKVDGLGALVIAPTRELAYQIFQELQKIGSKHDFSAACCVGGRSVDEEQERLGRINILVATPGRLLQHLDESPDFDITNLQMLVVDEADRILDLGFQDTMNNIMEHLKHGDRQTLLFSATMRASVRQLATLALKNPQVVSVHRSSSSSTPAKLKQMYMQVPLEKKVDALFSFLRAHSQKRMIVFVQTCKQVRFLYESFFKLKPGPAVMELHGKQSQEKRTWIFEEFKTKPRAVALICTDIAARGLDFPDVDWVVQMDCPDSVESYIHRVGRTARYQASGQGLLILAPSEMAFIDSLQKDKVQISPIKMKASKLTELVYKLQALLSHAPDIRHLAERAYVSYLRSVHFMADKNVFKIADLPKDAFAGSLGLAQTPECGIDEADVPKKKKLSKLERLKAKIKANKEAKRGKIDAKDSEAAEEGQKKSKWERRQETLQAKRTEIPVGNEEEEDDLLVKRAAEEMTAPTLRKPKKLKLDKDGVAKSAKYASNQTYFEDPSDFSLLAGAAPEIDETCRAAYVEEVKRRLAASHDADKNLQRKKLREKHLKVKERTTKTAAEAPQLAFSDASDDDIGDEDALEEEALQVLRS